MQNGRNAPLLGVEKFVVEKRSIDLRAEQPQISRSSHILKNITQISKNLRAPGKHQADARTYICTYIDETDPRRGRGLKISNLYTYTICPNLRGTKNILPTVEKLTLTQKCELHLRSISPLGARTDGRRHHGRVAVRCPTSHPAPRSRSPFRNWPLANR